MSGYYVDTTEIEGETRIVVGMVGVDYNMDDAAGYFSIDDAESLAKAILGSVRDARVSENRGGQD